ncbi:MAG: hypothetical protein ACREYE_19035, partial [Gammaproteobacteria bacterium]
PHVSSGVRSAGCNLIATRVVGMSETIAITGKSVKLFKGHYTSIVRMSRLRCRHCGGARNIASNTERNMNGERQGQS